MAHNSRADSGVNRDKNLILVSNNSDYFGENNLGTMLSRNSSYNQSDYRRNSNVSNLFQNFHQEVRPRPEAVKREDQQTDAQRYAQECLEYEKYLFDEKIRLIIHRMAILAYHNFK